MEPGSGLAHMMPPPSKPISRSAPGSQLGSPNVSPPHSFSNYSPNMGNDLAAYHQGGFNSSNSNSPSGLSRPMDLLADAASRLEQRPGHYSHSSRHHITSGYHPYASRLPGLSQYAYSSQPMSRSHSHEDDDPYSHRMTKKSRPGSPTSTAPPAVRLLTTPRSQPLLTHQDYVPTDSTISNFPIYVI
jgi:zinc finger protein CreA/MIG